MYITDRLPRPLVISRLCSLKPSAPPLGTGLFWFKAAFITDAGQHKYAVLDSFIGCGLNRASGTCD
jgi:hypothetical protein